VAEQSDAAIVESLRRHMSMAAARQVVAASNLANVNTPGYKAKEADFTQTLDRQLAQGVTLATTQPGHLAGTPSASSAERAIPTKDIEGATERKDGNSVLIDRELLTMTAAAGSFSRAQTTLAAKFKLLRYAISGG
jgi:flagellar basal-body rod protein FlgB